MSAPPIVLTDEIYEEILKRVKLAFAEAEDDDDFVVRRVISTYLSELRPEMGEDQNRAATFKLLAAWAKRTIMSLPNTGIRYDH